MAGKISQYPSSITTLASGDLFDVSEFLNPGYESKKLDWSTLLTELNSQITFANIYTTDGTTTGQRTISIGTNDLIFGSTGDTNLLRFDATADRIGIGTATPSEKLNIVGGLRIDGAGLNQLYVSPSSNFVGNGYTSNPSGLSNTRLATSGRMFAALSYSANDIALVSFSGGNIARFTNYSAGQDVELVTTSAADDVKIKNGATTTLISQGSTSNIGIGTLTPTKKLDVIGTGVFSDQIGIGTVAPNAATKLHVVSTDAIRLESATGGGFGHQDLISYQAGGGDNDYYRRVTSGGAALDFHKFAAYARLVRTNVPGATIRFGINTGTSTPSATQHIVGSETNLAALRVDGNGTTNDLVVDFTGNVGIGTATPTNKLEVVGNTDSTTYSVNGTAGANFSGAVTNITVVDGIVTAVS